MTKPAKHKYICTVVVETDAPALKKSLKKTIEGVLLDFLLLGPRDTVAKITKVYVRAVDLD